MEEFNIKLLHLDIFTQPEKGSRSIPHRRAHLITHSGIDTSRFLRISKFYSVIPKIFNARFIIEQIIRPCGDPRFQVYALRIIVREFVRPGPIIFVCIRALIAVPVQTVVFYLIVIALRNIDCRRVPVGFLNGHIYNSRDHEIYGKLFKRNILTPYRCKCRHFPVKDKIRAVSINRNILQVFHQDTDLFILICRIRTYCIGYVKLPLFRFIRIDLILSLREADHNTLIRRFLLDPLCLVKRLDDRLSTVSCSPGIRPEICHIDRSDILFRCLDLGYPACIRKYTAACQYHGERGGHCPSASAALKYTFRCPGVPASFCFHEFSLSFP